MPKAAGCKVGDDFREGRGLDAVRPSERCAASSHKLVREFMGERRHLGDVHLVEVECPCRHSHAFADKHVAGPVPAVKRSEHGQGIDAQPVPSARIKRVYVADELRMAGSEDDIETSEVGGNTSSRS